MDKIGEGAIFIKNDKKNSFQRQIVSNINFTVLRIYCSLTLILESIELSVQKYFSLLEFILFYLPQNSRSII